MDELDTQARAAGFQSFAAFFKTVSVYKRALWQNEQQQQALLASLRDPAIRAQLRTLPGGLRAERGRVNSGIICSLCLVAMLVLLLFQKWWLAVGATLLWLLVFRMFHKMALAESLARVWAIKEPLDEQGAEDFRDALLKQPVR